MASWLVSQLKAAENLLEAVDRTVSSATAGIGSHAPRTPSASRPRDSDGLQATHTVDSDQQHTLVVGSHPSSAASPSGTLAHWQQRPNGQHAGQQLFDASGSLKSQQQSVQQLAQPQLSPVRIQSNASDNGSPFKQPFPTSLGPEQPTSPAAAQPSSTGSYMLKQHGPFAPGPLQQAQVQQQAAVSQPAPVSPAAPPPPTITLAPARQHSSGPPAPAYAFSPKLLGGAFQQQLPASSSGGNNNSVSANGFGGRRNSLNAGRALPFQVVMVPSNVTGFAQQPLPAPSLQAYGSHIVQEQQQQVPQEQELQQQDKQQQDKDKKQQLQQQQLNNVPLELDALDEVAAAADAYTVCAAASAAGTATNRQSADGCGQIVTAAMERQLAKAGAEQVDVAAELHVSAADPSAVESNNQLSTLSSNEYAQQQQQEAEEEEEEEQQSGTDSHTAADNPPAAASSPQTTPVQPMLPSTTSTAASNETVTSATKEALPAAAAASTADLPAPSAKEVQLQRLVETLRKRFDTVKAENQQLEDMLHAAEQRTAAELLKSQQLESEVAAMQHAQDEIVASAAANAAAQDARISRLQQDLEGSSRQVAALHSALEAIQEQHQQVLNNKDAIEGGALEALRVELATAESQLDAERRAHAATKAAAATRERDLEEQLTGSSDALAATQRALEEGSFRLRELEEQQMLAVAEAARLREQVRLQKQQQTSQQQQETPGQQLQLAAEREAWQQRLNEVNAQVLAAGVAQKAADAQIKALQQKLLQLQQSYQAAVAKGPAQLEGQVQELQELLYQKQQQLERVSGEKQGQIMMLERQINTLKLDLGRAHAAAAAATSGGSSSRPAHDIIPMDALGEPYQRLARHRKLGGAVQATANFLDTTAASASQLLRQQPLVRLIVFLYIVLIHLYVYFLLARMQRQALQLMAGQDKTGPSIHEFGPH
eukprot:GHRR01004059.1.p1 GENE.GHRR01004059.1~~GHRR01004059.1.p1  ORF type:complete len:940 (+),score=461.32 GHRR01004059.1:146-2965(+)